MFLLTPRVFPDAGDRTPLVPSSAMEHPALLGTAPAVTMEASPSPSAEDYAYYKITNTMYLYSNPLVILAHYNYTGKLNNRDKRDRAVTTTGIVAIVVCCVIIVENLVVLLTFWRNRKFHTPTYYFLANLACSDLLAAAAYVANISLSGPNTFTMTPTAWFAREGVIFVALAASVFSFLAIAVERHLIMARRRLAPAIPGRRRVRACLLIALCWALALLLGSLPSLGWNCLRALQQCSVVLPLYSRRFLAFCVTLYTLVLAGIVTLYARVYAAVRRSGRRVGGNGGNGGCGGGTRKATPGTSRRSVLLLKTVFIVVGVFIACWTPLFGLLLADVACGTLRRGLSCSAAATSAANWLIPLAVLNSGMNPLIYAASSRDMRRAFARLLCCCCARGRLGAGESAANATRSRSSASSGGRPTATATNERDLTSPDGGGGGHTPPNSIKALLLSPGLEQPPITVKSQPPPPS
ncbi:unnamed protein product [Lampetra fluviatilis]